MFALVINKSIFLTNVINKKIKIYLPRSKFRQKGKKVRFVYCKIIGIFSLR